MPKTKPIAFLLGSFNHLVNQTFYLYDLFIFLIRHSHTAPEVYRIQIWMIRLKFCIHFKGSLERLNESFNFFILSRDMIMNHRKISYLSNFSKLFFIEAEVVIFFIPMRINFHIKIYPYSHFSFKFLQSLHLFFILYYWNYNKTLCSKFLNQNNV